MHTLLFLACADMSSKATADGSTAPLLIAVIGVGIGLIGAMFLLFHRL